MGEQHIKHSNVKDNVRNKDIKRCRNSIRRRIFRLFTAFEYDADPCESRLKEINRKNGWERANFPSFPPEERDVGCAPRPPCNWRRCLLPPRASLRSLQSQTFLTRSRPLLCCGLSNNIFFLQLKFWNFLIYFFKYIIYYLHIWMNNES